MVKVWKDKSGNWITAPEFVSRWKQGITVAVATMSPHQQNESQIRFTWIMLIGLVSGLVIAIVNWKEFWWVAIILFAGTGNVSVQQISFYQKRKAFENFVLFEKQLEGGRNESIKKQKRTIRI